MGVGVGCRTNVDHSSMVERVDLADIVEGVDASRPHHNKPRRKAKYDHLNYNL